MPAVAHSVAVLLSRVVLFFSVIEMKIKSSAEEIFIRSCFSNTVYHTVSSLIQTGTYQEGCQQKHCLRHPVFQQNCFHTMNHGCEFEVPCFQGMAKGKVIELVHPESGHLKPPSMPQLGTPPFVST